MVNMKVTEDLRVVIVAFLHFNMIFVPQYFLACSITIYSIF